MAKVLMALPKDAVKSGVLGAGVALLAYLLLQLLWALLISREVMGFSLLYPAVCVSAAVAAFLGCLVSVLRQRGATALSVTSVVAVFLSLTVAAGLLAGDGLAVEQGLTGVGLSMAAGGLAAALVGMNLPAKRRRERKRRQRRGR